MCTICIYEQSLEVSYAKSVKQISNNYIHYYNNIRIASAEGS